MHWTKPAIATETRNFLRKSFDTFPKIEMAINLSWFLTCRDICLSYIQKTIFRVREMMGLIIALFFVVLFVATQVWMIMKISDLSNRVKNLEKDSGEDKS
jgi:hypothetical protein